MTAILFNSLFPAVWVLIITVLAVLLLGLLEVKRGQRLLIPRLIALLLVISSLAGLVLNPVRTIKKSSNIIILTKGFDKAQLDSLLQANSASQVYQLNNAEAGKAAIKLENYRDLDKLRGNLFVLGHGIPPYMLDYVDTSAIQFFPASVPDGFTRITMNKKYIANQASSIDGIFKSTAAARITLTGPGIAEDSISLKANSINTFALAFNPKTAGLYNYTLAAADSSGKIIHTEQLPVEVKDQKALSILIVADYPTAEIRFLKNFLGSQNHKVIVRYRISKDKYRTEFTNTNQRSIGRLNESLLKEMDLVITDISGFASLSAAEIESLKEAERSGLGSLTLLNTSELPKSVKNYLDLDVTRTKSDSAQLAIRKKLIKVPATSIQVSSATTLSIIQEETGGRIISGYHTNGLGKSGFQLLDNTYVLELSGEKDMYAQLWSAVINALARRDIKKYDLLFTSPLPYYEDEPVEFKIIAAAEKPSVSLNSAEVSLAEDPLIKNVWHGKIWADQTGWHTLNIKQDSSNHNFFVSSIGSWSNIRIDNQQRALQNLVSKKTGSGTQLTHQRIPPLIFLILFLLSAGFLWLAPKI